MRLIDADALRKKMYHEAFGTDSDMQKWESGCWVRYKMFENALESAPTIGSVPVKHGEWIWMGEQGDSRFMCSVCKGKENVPTIMGKPTVWEYCPNCGAKIDGGEDDERIMYR